MPAPSTPPFPPVLWTGSFRRSSRRRTYTIGRRSSRNQAVKRGMYHSRMPASDRYSAAARQLVAELRARDYRAGCRAVEQWAAWGLAPAPERVSLGRRGFTSRYPDGAIDQYAAVASVMRRGQDWRAAGLMLIGRGHLVAREETFRLLLDYLFAPDTGISDPLEFADEQMAAAAGQPLFKRIARIAQRNISAAKLTDPVTGCEIDAETAAVSVMARGVATMLGEAMPRDAAEETAAAWGMITADLPADVREHRIDVVNALADTVPGLICRRLVPWIVPRWPVPCVWERTSSPLAAARILPGGCLIWSVSRRCQAGIGASRRRMCSPSWRPRSLSTCIPPSPGWLMYPTRCPRQAPAISPRQ